MSAVELPFLWLDALWLQVAGTRCNIACRHCLVSAGPRSKAFPMMTVVQVEQALADGERHGMREVWFTGGEPFWHPDILALVDRALAIAPLGVLTNGMLVDDDLAESLARLARAAEYDLEIRVSLDGPDSASNDAIRGQGTFEAACEGIRRLAAVGLDPAVAVVAIDTVDFPAYERLVGRLGVTRPRLKKIPPFRVGREVRRDRAYEPWERVSAEQACDAGAPARLQCATSRTVTSNGVFPCPILVDEPGRRIADDLAGAMRAHPVDHPGLLDLLGARVFVRSMIEAPRIALFGGAYSNFRAVEATVADARRRGAEALFFLGDAGGFGPHPDRTVEALRSLPIVAVQGNYDDAIGNARTDCACGYTDPRDQAWAQLSFDYTAAATAPEHRAWLAALPAVLRVRVGSAEVLLCHGSPRRQNEFLWESTTPRGFIDRLCTDAGVDLVACTHTGLHWQRRLADGRGVVNVGAIGRPANDGRTCVWYALLEAGPNGVETTFVPVDYDWPALVSDMHEAGLPEAFAETIATGWWTTCLEVLPARERRKGRF